MLIEAIDYVDLHFSISQYASGRPLGGLRFFLDVFLTSSTRDRLLGIEASYRLPVGSRGCMHLGGLSQ